MEPTRGTITSWQPDDSIGRIRLATGEEIRFGHSACVNVKPALGAEVWVTEVAPHPLGGLRAKVVNATGEVTPDRATAALVAHEEREKRRPAIQAEVDAIHAECTAALSPRATPWTVARQAGIDLLPLGAIRTHALEDLAAIAPSLRALDDAGKPDASLCLYAWEWANDWAYLELWTDPCFLPLVAPDADQLGVFAHPALAAQGVPFPVVFRFHETESLHFIAESLEHLSAMIDAAASGSDPEPARGTRHEAVVALLGQTREEEAFEDVERKDVHALFWSHARGLESAAAERLAARYRDRGWAYALASIEAQQVLSSFQDRVDAAWKGLG